MSPEIASIAIRRARPSDAPAVARVYVKAWRSAYAGIVPDKVLVGMSEVGQAGHWNRQIAADQSAGPNDTRKGPVVLVAEADRDRIVGVGSAGAARGAGPELGEVYTLYVDPDWHGLGIGRALLGGLFRALRTMGREGALLWVLAENPSRFFYETVGGRRVAERVERLWGADLAEIGYRWDDLGTTLAPDGPFGDVAAE